MKMTFNRTFSDFPGRSLSTTGKQDPPAQSYLEPVLELVKNHVPRRDHGGR